MANETLRRGSAGQTFLVGEEFYLRGLEPDDATRAAAWRLSPFPVSAARAEEALKTDVPKDAERYSFTLVACRVANDAPVGAVMIDQPYVIDARLSLHSTPALGADGARVRAAILRLVMGWLTKERSPASILLALDADEQEPIAAAEEAGMRPAARLREALWRDGGRHDDLRYEWLHPAWTAKIGDPGPGIANAGEPVVAPRSPAPLAWPVALGDSGSPDRGGAPLDGAATTDGGPGASDAARNAIMVGPRVLLRAREVEDAERMARANRQETETFFNRGRMPWSPIVFADWFRKWGETEPPDTVEFSIVRREDGALIGENGIYDIDWIARTAETGSYLYRAEYRGGGYGTEAKHLLLAFAFDRLGLHMVRSNVLARNTRSAAALRKQGYRDAGRLRWLGLQDGAWTEAFMFDLLAAEWRAARR